MEYGAHTPLACGGRWLAGRWFVVFGEPPKTAREPRALPEINGGDGCLQPAFINQSSTWPSGRMSRARLGVRCCAALSVLTKAARSAALHDAGALTFVVTGESRTAGTAFPTFRLAKFVPLNKKNAWLLAKRLEDLLGPLLFLFCLGRHFHHSAHHHGVAGEGAHVGVIARWRCSEADHRFLVIVDHG